MDDLELTRDISHTFLHIIQSITEGTDISSVKSNTIVMYSDPQHFINLYMHDYSVCISMFYNIVECFFYGEINITTKFTAHKYRREFGRCIHLTLDAVIQEIFHRISTR